MTVCLKGKCLMTICPEGICLLTGCQFTAQPIRGPLLNKPQCCGMNTFGAQWCGYFFILCYTHLNWANLLLKTVLINLHHYRCIIFSFGNCMYSKHHPVKILKILFQINPLFELIKNLWQKTSLTKFEVQ